ncbi:MAG: ABC transporter ATP-binding protein, partial [Bacteroidota bacterium]|nr:ABC transporter ATP-binding protein [Bacteroidota bacterium]
AAFRSILASAFSEDKTIILSTHMVRDLESLIDSVIILENRRIILNTPLNHIARKLSFSRSLLSLAPAEIVYSASGELGPVNISINHTDLEGNIDLEALFNACIYVPEKISACLV